MSAAWQVGMLHLLLSDGAERARAILRDFKPTFASKEEFLAYQDAQNSSGDRIIYTDGKAEVAL